MSVDLITRAYAAPLEQADVSGSSVSVAAQRAVLVRLADYANGAGEAYPSLPRQARETGLSVRHVRRVHRALVAVGYLTIRPGGGRGYTNLYRLTLPPLRKRGHGDPVLAAERGPDVPKPGRGVTETGTPRPPNRHEPSGTSRARAREDGRRASTSRPEGWVENLGAYTGCRLARGEIGSQHVYDPLGTERPPPGWQHPKPRLEDVREALRAREEER